MSGARACAVIVAGGSGTRFSANGPKQFHQVAGRPLLAHTLERFQTCTAIGRIALVLPRDGFEESVERMRPFLEAGVSCLAGGDTRQASVWEGLCGLALGEDDLVVVHDGARPCADHGVISRVVEAAAESGAAIAAIPVVETLKEVETAEGELTIRSTVDRARFFRAQTPQGFRYRLLARAFEEAQRAGFVGTDEASLVERLGASVRIVAGSESNIKVTTAEDLERLCLELDRTVG